MPKWDQTQQHSPKSVTSARDSLWLTIFSYRDGTNEQTMVIGLMENRYTQTTASSSIVEEVLVGRYRLFPQMDRGRAFRQNH